MGIDNLDDSLLYFNKAVEKEPHNTTFLMNRAQCYFYLGEKDKCAQELELALQYEQAENPKILYKLGLAYYSIENFKKAIKTLK